MALIASCFNFFDRVRIENLTAVRSHLMRDPHIAVHCGTLPELSMWRLLEGLLVDWAHYGGSRLALRRPQGPPHTPKPGRMQLSGSQLFAKLCSQEKCWSST